MEPHTATQKCILIVDPSEEERARVTHAFDGLGYQLLEASDMAQALQLIEANDVDLVLSEIVLPDVSGFALCRLMREQPSTQSLPIILISGWCGEADRILAFEAGADDFSEKPFYERELAARVRAVLRRSAGEAPEVQPKAWPALEEDGFEIRQDANEIYLDDRVVPLTRREFALVVALMKRRGRVLGRDELISTAWGDLDAPNARSVDAHIKSIRRKLGQVGRAIETIRGVGYRFSDIAIGDGRAAGTEGAEAPDLVEP